MSYFVTAFRKNVTGIKCPSFSDEGDYHPSNAKPEKSKNENWHPGVDFTAID